MTKQKKDYYGILGVPSNADQEIIKKTFREKALKFHPDKNPGDSTAEEKFKEINEANQVLSDPQKRAMYDRGDELPNMEDVIFGGVSDIFDFINSAFGGSRARINGIVRLTLKEVIQGTKKKINIVIPERVSVPSTRMAHAFVNKEYQGVEVTIPPGVQHGMVVPMEVEINTSKKIINIQVEFEQKENVQVQDANVGVILLISYKLAVIGGEMKVNLLDDSTRTITINPGSQPGTQIRLEEQGLPVYPGLLNERGDLVFILQIQVPTQVSTKAKRLLKRFDSEIS